MQKNRVNHANHDHHAEHAADPGPSHPEPTPTGQANASPDDAGLAASRRYEHLAAGLDDLAAVPTYVLADWVVTRGRCLWETTVGDPPDWLTDPAAEPDRELATRLCAGCPVRSECLEFELRETGEDTVGVWGGLNAEDRRALLQVWRARRRDDLAALPDDEGWWRPTDPPDQPDRPNDRGDRDGGAR